MDIHAGVFGKSLQLNPGRKLERRICFLHLNERVDVMNDFLRLHSFLEPKSNNTKKGAKHRLSKHHQIKQVDQISGVRELTNVQNMGAKLETLPRSLHALFLCDVLLSCDGFIMSSGKDSPVFRDLIFPSVMRTGE